jgi:hypothetical protein
VFTALFHSCRDEDNLEVSRVDMRFRLVRVTHRRLRQATDRTPQDRRLCVLRVDVGADSTEQIVAVS